MKRFLRLALALTAFTITATCASAQQPAPKAINSDAIEPLTRGPIHEAFLQPNDATPAPSPVVPKEPPPPVPEQPPEERPDGKDVQWMSGYWAWDADRNDFIWVSGGFRDVPPNRQYTPGYWANTADGWQWVPGYWGAMNQPEQPYVPEPPAPLDNGPSIPAPDDNSMYVPGNWAYNDSRFAWRPGYWTPYRSGMVWVAPRYQWTPAGYLSVPGYWDYPLDARGMMFAPAYFNDPLYNQPGYAYTPNYVVPWNSVYGSAFYRPRWGMYYGNYFGNNYANLGYRPWYSGNGAYNSAFAYYRWSNRNTPNWYGNYQQSYANRLAGRAPLPPSTYAAQVKVVNNNINVITPYTQVRNNTNVRLVKTTTNTKTQINHSLATAQTRRANELALAKRGTTHAPVITHNAAKVTHAAPVITHNTAKVTHAAPVVTHGPVTTHSAKVTTGAATTHHVPQVSQPALRNIQHTPAPTHHAAPVQHRAAVTVAPKVVHTANVMHHAPVTHARSAPAAHVTHSRPAAHTTHSSGKKH